MTIQFAYELQETPIKVNAADPTAVAAAAPLVLAEAAQELGQLVDVERGGPVGPVQAAGQSFQREVIAEQGGIGRTRAAPLELPPLRERRPYSGRTAASCSRSGLKAAAWAGDLPAPRGAMLATQRMPPAPARPQLDLHLGPDGGR